MENTGGYRLATAHVYEEVIELSLIILLFDVFVYLIYDACVSEIGLRGVCVDNLGANPQDAIPRPGDNRKSKLAPLGRKEGSNENRTRAIHN
jgi:hypothetical protein